jgi:hypothetical protein
LIKGTGYHGSGQFNLERGDCGCCQTGRETKLGLFCFVANKNS